VFVCFILLVESSSMLILELSFFKLAKFYEMLSDGLLDID